MTLWLRPNPPPPSLPAWDYSPPRTLTLVAWEVRGDSTATVAERFGGSSPRPPKLKLGSSLRSPPTFGPLECFSLGVQGGSTDTVGCGRGALGVAPPPPPPCENPVVSALYPPPCAFGPLEGCYLGFLGGLCRQSSLWLGGLWGRPPPPPHPSPPAKVGLLPLLPTLSVWAAWILFLGGLGGLCRHCRL